MLPLLLKRRPRQARSTPARQLILRRQLRPRRTLPVCARSSPLLVISQQMDKSPDSTTLRQEAPLSILKEMDRCPLDILPTIPTPLTTKGIKCISNHVSDAMPRMPSMFAQSLCKTPKQLALPDAYDPLQSHKTALLTAS